MKKILYAFVALLATTFMLSSCGSDDDDNGGVQITMEQVVGTWDVTSLQSNGQSMSLTKGMVYITLTSTGNYRTKYLNNTYIGTFKLSGSTVVGTTLDPITEYYKFTSLNGNVATIEYSNSTGDSYTFTAVKRTSSNNDDDDSYTKKNEVEFTIDWSLVESGSMMTRSTGSDAYSEFYTQYIATKKLTPATYNLTFTEKTSGATATFTGRWDNKAIIKLTEGEYIVTGSSVPSANTTDTLRLAFQDTVSIKKDMTSLTLKAKNDSYLLLFNANTIESSIYKYYTSPYNTPIQKTCKQGGDVLYMFMKSILGVTGKGYNTIVITSKNGNTATLDLYNAPFTVGKYYYFDNIESILNIPTMEEGN